MMMSRSTLGKLESKKERRRGKIKLKNGGGSR
jgi:hypothetical protein